MSRSGTAHQRTVALLAIGWLLSFGMSLDDVLSGTAFPPVLIEPVDDAAGYPRVVAVKPGLHVERSGLRVGDRITRVGDVDVARVGAAAWRAAFAVRRATADAPIAYLRDGVPEQTRIPLATMRPYWPRLAASAAFVVCALLLVVRVKPSPLQRAIVRMNLAVAMLLSCFFAGGVVESWIGLAAQLVSASLVMPLSIHTYQLFPNRAPSGSALSRWGPWAFVALGPLDLSRFTGVPFSHAVGSMGTAVVSAAFAVVVIALITNAYRRSSHSERRQIKWVLLGLYFTTVTLVIASAVAAATPGAGWLLAIAVSATGVIPICMLIAVGRYNFLDVDGLLSGAAAGSLVLGLGVAAVFLALPPITEALTAQLGIHRTVGQFFVIAALAAVAVPTQRLLRGTVSRVLFATRQQLEAGIVRLNGELSRCESPEQLATMASRELAALFGVDRCAVYLRSGELFVPMTVRGELDLPRFAKGSPLLSVLEDQPGPLTQDVDAGAATSASLGPFQQAVLDTLRVPLVLPIRRDRELVAFLCMGAKRTDDVYTPVDLALLALVADKIASELRRFDQADMIEAGHAMQERLRRYVPGPLAEQLSRGEEIDATEREVSVLFVDIRGFSAFTEGLSPEQIFRTVNDYTTAVSTIIDDHGGTVVEFNGDGMMAVFGAPRAIDSKEHAAVAAGRAIVECVPQLAGATGTLTVGIGVATGEAFVGSVQAVDRMIWTALGNTTNRASRLQSLTREYDAAMLIDEATWQLAGGESERFWEIGELAIRGLEARATVYALPRPVPA